MRNKNKLIIIRAGAVLLTASMFLATTIDIHTLNRKEKNNPFNDIKLSEIDVISIDNITNSINVITLPKRGNKVEPIKVKTLEEKPIESVKDVVELPIEERIKKACETHNVPFNIVLAIARLETGWFKSDAYIYGNNPGGLSINEVPMSFDSIDDGVEAFVFNLSRNYFAIGLDTPEKIGEKYCPVEQNWASEVSELSTYGY